MNALLLLDDGWAAERVADALFIDAETVREHRRLYETTGVFRLERLNYEGSDPALSEAQLDALKTELDAHLSMRSKEVCDFVWRTFEPAKADAAVQQFAKETLLPLMVRANTDNPVYFVDGMHPSYTAHPGFGWIRRGVTRELRSNHGRVNVNINGALSWPDREVVHFEAEKITSDAMIALFDTLMARHPTTTAINVVLDNASYKRSAAVKEYLAREGCRILLVFLPPYAPNLNLIERLWWFLKKTTLWNQYFRTFADFKPSFPQPKGANS